MKVPVCLLSVSLVLAATPVRGEEHPTWTLSAGAVYVDPDGDARQSSEGNGFSLGFGRYFGPRVSVDVEYDDYDFGLKGGGENEIDTLGLMVRYHFDTQGKWKPYLGAGAGEADHRSTRGNGKDFMAQAAGGFHYPLTDHLDLRGELRWRLDSDNHTGPNGPDNFNDWLVTVGVQWALGKAGTPAPAPRTATPAAPATPATPDTPSAPAVRDSDGDGVADDRDRCPRTPAGAPVDAHGCPKDSDGDGVPDYRDDCPDTPAGTTVGPNGCEAQLLIELPSVYFDFDRATLKPEARQVLAEVVDKLTENDVIRIAIEGHTDWVGTEAYNINLSERRAKSVYDHLAAAGIGSSRMRWSGFGESRPIADNDSEAGRARNRRVEIRIVD